MEKNRCASDAIGIREFSDGMGQASGRWESDDEAQYSGLMRAKKQDPPAPNSRQGGKSR